MDISLAQAAETLGTSVPRLTRAIARLGITPRKRGRGQVLSGVQVVRLRRYLGWVPIQCADSREEMYVLAAFNLSPFGFRSARSVAAVAGISPTTASARLHTLVDHGLVTETKGPVLQAGRVADGVTYTANRRSAAWGARIGDIRRVELPQGEERTRTLPKRLPRSLWHLFWNASPSTLSLRDNADYIASRLLLSDEPRAIAWAALHLPPHSIAKAGTLRGVTDHDRQWLAKLAEVA